MSENMDENKIELSLPSEPHELAIRLDTSEWTFKFSCNQMVLGQIMISMLHGTAITLGQDPAPILKDLQDQFLKGPKPKDTE